MRRAYFFGGVNGVGKSTVLNSIIADGKEFELFKGSARLMQRLGVSPGDYAALRAIPDEVKEAEVNAMMEEVLSEGDENSIPLLIDAHFLNYKKGEMRDATGTWMRHLSGIFIVEADAEMILDRARTDESTGKRHRDLLQDGLSPDEELAWINRYLLATRGKANEVAQMYGIPAFTLINTEPDISPLLERFKAIHQHITDGEDFLPNFK